MTVESLIMLASAGIIFTLGLIHLIYTFFGLKLHPRINEVKLLMESNFLVITKRTSIWRAWIGFNASHSLGAILFGLFYGFLSTIHPELLFDSLFLQTLGLGFLISYFLIGWRYWFSVPFSGITLALILYIASLLVAVI